MRNPGFTLLELIVVITILGVLAAVIVPQFGGTFEGALLHSAGRDLMAAMNLAYSQAVTSGKPCQLRVDPQKSSYWLETSDQPDEKEERFLPLTSVPGSAGDLDRRILIAVQRPTDARGDRRNPPSRHPPSRGPVETILFRPDGTCEACEVHLRDRDGFGLLLKVNPTTSRVRAKKLGKDAAP